MDDPVIIGALIGAGGTIIGATIYLIGTWYNRKKLAEEEKRTKKAINELGKKQPDKVDIVYEYEKTILDIDNSGNCSMVRRNKITAPPGVEPINDKKFKLIGDKSIQLYADKLGKNIGNLDPDKEFKITARDVTTGVRLSSSTRIEGDQKEELTTNILFDTPLTSDNPIEIEITYQNLDVSFFCTKLWEEPHVSVWTFQFDNPCKELEAEIIFPEILPDWFTKSDIAVATIPKDWDEVDKYIKHNKRHLCLKASNLETEKLYILKIDIGQK